MMELFNSDGQQFIKHSTTNSITGLLQAQKVQRWKMKQIKADEIDDESTQRT